MRTISSRITVHRLPERAEYDRAVIEAILDEALICHVGFVQDGQPFVIPTIHGRDGDLLYLHGSSASRMLRELGREIPVCVTVTLLDGIVLARSAFHHSMNYRSVVVLGTGQEVQDREEKLRALEVISEHVMPGRWAEVRRPSEQELRQTRILRVGLDEASAKMRSGGPKDDEGDLRLPVWGGVLPVQLVTGDPLPDEHVSARVELPDYIGHHHGVDGASRWGQSK